MSGITKTSNLGENSTILSLIDRLHEGRTAWTVLGISLMLTLWAAWLSHVYAANSERERFERRTAEVVQSIERRLLLYEQSLWGGVGLFDASKEVSRSEFAAFVESLDIDKNLPGIQGFGFSLAVDAADRDAHITSIRSEDPLFLDYEIKPAGERDAYSSIVYIEPFDWRNRRAFGFDMWSNEIRREAMERARDTGEAANSGIITLVQETGEDVQRGFLMYTPVYKKLVPKDTHEARRDALIGWVYSPFRGRDLMHGILGEQAGELDIEVFDGKKMVPDQRLYDSDGLCHVEDAKHQPRHQSVKALDMQGRPWTVYVHTSREDSISRKQSKLPLLIGGLGLLVDALLFFVIFSLQRLQRRTKVLANSLEGQKRELEQANQELTQFAYVASHDLQEPLRTVSNFAGLLEADYAEHLDEDGVYALRTMKGATVRMQDLIHDVLDYSQLGELTEEPSALEPSELLAQIREDLCMQFEESGAHLVLGDLPMVRGSRPLIRQVFTNLISNAVKYRREGVPPKIRVWGEVNSEGVVYHVEDNGIGIPEDQQGRVFEIFRRLHRRTEFEGTGIGLASCEKIVRLHGGKIWLKSNPEHGSIFSFLLPHSAP